MAHCGAAAAARADHAVRATGPDSEECNALFREVALSAVGATSREAGGQGAFTRLWAAADVPMQRAGVCCRAWQPCTLHLLQ